MTNRRSEDYYWITAHYEGRDILIFGGNSYEEAERKGYQELPCMFEVVKLPTRSTAAASRMIKAQTLEQTHDLDRSLRNIRHKM